MFRAADQHAGGARVRASPARLCDRGAGNLVRRLGPDQGRAVERPRGASLDDPQQAAGEVETRGVPFGGQGGGQLRLAGKDQAVG